MSAIIAWSVAWHYLVCEIGFVFLAILKSLMKHRLFRYLSPWWSHLFMSADARLLSYQTGDAVCVISDDSDSGPAFHGPRCDWRQTLFLRHRRMIGTWDFLGKRVYFIYSQCQRCFYALFLQILVWRLNQSRSTWWFRSSDIPSPTVACRTRHSNIAWMTGVSSSAVGLVDFGIGHSLSEFFAKICADRTAMSANCACLFFTCLLRLSGLVNSGVGTHHGQTVVAAWCVIIAWFLIIVNVELWKVHSEHCICSARKSQRLFFDIILACLSCLLL